MTNNQKKILSDYRKSVESIENLKWELFRPGTDVFVDSERYYGPGISVIDITCWPDHVAVSLPNGNTWRYPIESVEPLKNNH